MTAFWGTVPRPLADVLPLLDGAARENGWAVSPSSTIYRRFYSKGMSAWSNGAHATVDLWEEDGRTRLRLTVVESALADIGIHRARSRKRATKLMATLGGALDGDQPDG